MTHSPRTILREPRRAFTLVEILMVLALMVILAAMTWPSMGRPMATQALRSAADDVRTAWARARIDAMNTGCTYKFQYEPGGNCYEIQGQPDAGTTGDGGATGFGFGETTPVQDAIPQPAERHRLPEGIRFVGGQTTIDTRAQMAASDGTASNDAQVALSDPIFFYPDGTTSSACLRLQNDFRRAIELSLRGLTGVVTVGPMQDAPPDVATGRIGP